MRSLTMVAAALALASTTAARAATDSGLHFQDNRGAGIRNGIGAEMAVKLRLGSRRTVYPSDRFNLRIGAGPIVSRSNGKRFSANLLSANLSPGYKAELSFAGQTLVTRYSESGFAEARARGLDEGSRSGITTLGWVGIGAGALVGILGVAYLALEDAIDCTENGQYVCE